MPLALVEIMQLKLASALLAQPRILVLSALYDMVPVDHLEAAFAMLKGKPVTILYFSSRPHDITLDGWLWLGRKEQRLVADRDSLDALRNGAGKEAGDAVSR
jgi:putative ABC transport system ATP-binding protein